METLKSNTVEERFEKEINDKKKKVEDILLMSDGQFEARKDTFFENIQKFKKSGKQNYNFLTRAGIKFQNTVFKLCQRMITEETLQKQQKL